MPARSLDRWALAVAADTRAKKASSFAVLARPSKRVSSMRARAGSPTIEAIQARSVSALMHAPYGKPP